MYLRKLTAQVLSVSVKFVSKCRVQNNKHGAEWNCNSLLEEFFRQPVFPVQDVTGIIADFQVGQQVIARPDPSRQVTCAQYVAVAEHEVAIKPANVSHLEAASLPLAGLTAWKAVVETAAIRPG
jgi:NADPH:quinone reductase-like Zn-dependent oxidoreductase